MVMPCNPSAPPVSQPVRFASSNNTSEILSVTISRVRSDPRNTRKLLAKPSPPATAAAAARPDSGSFQPDCARMPAV